MCGVTGDTEREGTTYLNPVVICDPVLWARPRKPVSILHEPQFGVSFQALGIEFKALHTQAQGQPSVLPAPTLPPDGA